jgi:hypothetical protein
MIDDKLRMVYQRHYDFIANNPGHRPNWYAEQMNYGASNFMNVLAGMEYNGFLLYEENNCLYPYRVVRRYKQELFGDPISKSVRWRRTGSELELYEPKTAHLTWRFQ